MYLLFASELKPTESIKVEIVLYKCACNMLASVIRDDRTAELWQHVRGSQPVLVGWVKAEG